MKKSTVLEIICVLLILLFVYTAASKFIHFDNFRTFVVGQTPLLRPFANVMAVVIPSSELIAVALLLVPHLRKWGLYASFTLMATFTLYVLYALYLAPKVPCACGGIIRQMTWKQHLLFNSVFTLSALTGIWLHKQKTVDNSEVRKVQFT